MRRKMSRIQNLVNESKEILGRAIAMGERPLLAYSNGKDAVATAHIASEMGIKDAVSEGSFMFAKWHEDARKNAKQLGLRCEFKDSLDLAWLRRHPELLFTNSSKIKGWGYSVRQQATVKRHARMNGYGMIVYGRRTQENCVPREIYRLKEDGWQCHPLRGWKLEDVWEYLTVIGIRPWIYDSPWGLVQQGNAPFYSLSRKWVGEDPNECWRLVTESDPSMTPQSLYGVDSIG